jgi:acyl dehydratase
VTVRSSAMGASQRPNPAAPTHGTGRVALPGAVTALAGAAIVLFAATTIYWWVWALDERRVHAQAIWLAMIPTGGLVLAIAMGVLGYSAVRSSS